MSGIAILHFFVRALRGIVIGPVDVSSVISESMSSLTLGVNVSVSGAVTPADIRPGGVCVSVKKERTAMGRFCGRKALNV